MKTRHAEILFRFRHGQARFVRVCLLTASFCLFGAIGCSEQPTPAPQPQEAKKELGPPPSGQSEPEIQSDPIELPNPMAGEKSVRDLGTKTLSETVDYYSNGPQQASPPDGQIQAGTEVTIIERAGSYTLIETADGIRGYVASSAVGVLE